MKYRTNPVTTVMVIITRKKYVGIANVIPESFTPRKLITMTNKIIATAISILKRSIFGKAEMICATPDEIETDTVNT